MWVASWGACGRFAQEMERIGRPYGVGRSTALDDGGSGGRVYKYKVASTYFSGEGREGAGKKSTGHGSHIGEGRVDGFNLVNRAEREIKKKAGRGRGGRGGGD